MPRQELSDITTDIVGKLQKKPGSADHQSELFGSWYVGAGESEKSRSLAIWDIIPWRVLTSNRTSTLPKVMVFEGVRLDEAREATVHLTPAILPGEGDGPPRVIFPGAREELVERALRKLAVSRLAASGPQPDPMGDNMAVSITFSIHQLRRELEENGHGFKFADIREALDVMHLANVRVECPADSLVHRASGPVLGNLQSICDPDDTDGKRSVYRATFHPIASAAILKELYFPINYTRMMTLSRPLARWIVSLLNVRFRYATRGVGRSKRSFRLTLKRVMTDSGMQPEPRLTNNIDRVREAIKELQGKGFLERWVPMKEIETIRREGTSGRPKIVDGEWELYPSELFAKEIIQGNQERKAVRELQG